MLHHFSENGSIDRFTPHVPKSNPFQEAAVWAIDTEHAPLYWFPRDCPRVAVWSRQQEDRPAFDAAFATTLGRVHVVELGWLDRISSVRLYRYDFERSAFAPWVEAEGQWISRTEVEPVAVTELPSLFDLHAAAGIELRAVADLASYAKLAVSAHWDFSLVRMSNARDT